MKIIEDLYTKDCIRTYTGKYVNVFDPKPEMFCIEDIAHSLANQCRFGAHLPFFYSVASHSIECVIHASKQLRFTALMHDASEAYLMDIPKPIKLRIPQYQAIEDGLMQTLSEVFGFIYPFPDEIKAIDKMVLENEWDEFMLGQGRLTTEKFAEQLFIDVFNEYKT